jgi:hypothetical protein
VNKLKIAVCTIAKDEAQHVDRFMQSCIGADYMIIGLDVRTTDNTEELLKKWGATIVPIDVSPWHFGNARNIVMDALPEDVDIVVAIDLDEVLSPNWRDVIEKEWEPDLDLLNYLYIYNWEDDACTKPGLIINGFKIFNRHSYIWQLAIHENLKYLKEGEEKKKFTDKITVYHYPDLKKDRNYIEILDKVVEGEPDNTWALYCRMRDHFTSKRYALCIEDAKKYLSVTPSYTTLELGDCRSEACIKIARSIFFLRQANTYEHMDEVGDIVTWLLRAVAEHPNKRESYVWLGEAWLMVFNSELNALACFKNALSLTDKSFSAELELRCWDDGYLINQIKNLKLKLNLKNKHI